MTGNRGKAPKMRFIFGILAPVLLGVLATFVIVGGLIYLSAQKGDEQAISHQQALVEHVLGQQRAIVRQQQADVVAWPDAVDAVTGDFDTEWISENLGFALFDFAGHDLAFVLDPRLEPVFAMRSGGDMEPETFNAFRSQFEPFAQRLRGIDWQGALSAYINGASHVIPSVGDYLLIEGKPAIVTFMPIASDDQRQSYVPGGEYIHVTVQFLDKELADGIGEQLLLSDAHFSIVAETPSDQIAIPLTDRSGLAVAQFVWAPSRPGAAILSESAPAIGVALAIVTVIIGALVFSLSRSTAELEAGREAAQHMAFHDKLTGLANRALFEDRLTQAIASARRGPAGIALMMMDLDRFKQVNDTLGHEAGDELIRQVAERLRPLLRDTDTIARLGGDEFAIIQSDTKSMDDVELVANRIIRAIAEPFNVASSQAFVGASIGIVLAPADATNAADLARKADIALYEAKGGGRNQFKMFEDRMSEAVQKRQTIEAELRDALKSREGLEVGFHPLVGDKTGELVGVEADISWSHSELGTVPAERFISVAESCGLIEQIGEFMLRSACEMGAANPNLRVSVRVFSAQLRNPSFFSRVFTVLDETGMAPSDLEIEICEKMLVEGETIAASALRKFRQAGVNIALGDFGTGFRSLKLLQKFQVDRIKIDRTFIAQLADSPDAEAITHSVVWLARAMGAEVSADGVDTIEQKKFLSRMGVMSFQGALFLPEDLEAWQREATNVENNTEPRKLAQDDTDILDGGDSLSA